MSPSNFFHTGSIDLRQAATSSFAQLLDLRLAGVRDLLLVGLVDVVGQLVRVLGCLVHRLGEGLAHVRGEAVPPLGVGHDHVVDHAVVGLGDGLLHLVELLRVDVRPGVLLAVDHAGLQRLVDLAERHLLRVRAERAELRLEHVGRLDAELEALDVFGPHQPVLVGRQLLHAVVPVAEPDQPAVGHRRQQRLARRARLEAVDGIDVVEQERQVEDLDLLRVAVELRQRRRDQLHVAQQQRLELLGVAEQLRAREHLHLHLAGQLLLGQLLELERALALRRVLRHDVAELDHDRLLGRSGQRQRDGEGGDAGGGEPLPAR